MTTQWSFAGYTFPWADQPERRGSGDWNYEQKSVEHEPLMASVTIQTDWGVKSRRRTVTGTCSATTRDQMQTFQLAFTVGALVDSEGRSMNAKIVKATFRTLLPKDASLLDCEGAATDGRYKFTIEFMER
jgi:hypothetical protein